MSKIFDIKGCFGSQGNYFGWLEKYLKKGLGQARPLPPKEFSHVSK